MADTQDLLRLADEVAAATGPDDKLAALVWRALSGALKSDHWYTDFRGVYVTDHTAPNALASVDDALLTVPEGQESAVLHEAWRAVSNGHALHIRFWKRETDGDYAQALARQITAAALKARAHSTKETSNG